MSRFESPLPEKVAAFERTLMPDLRNTTRSRRFRLAYVEAREAGKGANEAFELAKRAILGKHHDPETTTALTDADGRRMVATAQGWFEERGVDLAGLSPFRQGSTIWFSKNRVWKTYEATFAKDGSITSTYDPRESDRPNRNHWRPGVPVRGGFTDKLNAAVTEEAEWLSRQFGGDVEVRFNSGGLSGGAWLVDPIWGNSGVGLSADSRGEFSLIAHVAAPFNKQGVNALLPANSLAAAQKLLLSKVTSWVRLSVGKALSSEEVTVGDFVVLSEVLEKAGGFQSGRVVSTDVGHVTVRRPRDNEKHRFEIRDVRKVIRDGVLHVVRVQRA